MRIFHNSSHQQVDKITGAPSKVISLQEFDIVNFSFNPTVIDNFFMALINISSLKVLKVKNTDIGNDVVDCIKAVSKNCCIEELNISSNNFTASGIVEVIQAVSKTIKILDISNNFEMPICSDEINMLAGALAGCVLLEEFNISHNLLTFDNVLQIEQALRCLSNLRTFNHEQ